MNLNKLQNAKERYAELGVDVDKAIKTLGEIKISMHCWQGDDVKGFLFRDADLSGGIAATGNYPGAARNPDELRCDLDKAFSLIAGKHKVNLHSIYADTNENIELNELEPRHFSSWVDYAKDRSLGLDFNPTLFSHKMAESGFTLSSADQNVRKFWVEHCKRSRKIGEYFGKKLGQTAATNIWIPDGFKDIPADRLAPRQRLAQSLDEILGEKINPVYNVDSVESKLFGIGSESYVVGSHEFYLGYAVKNDIALTLDSGHFHPTETVSNKISSVLMYVPKIVLHVSRPVRWDSDHVVIFDDELQQIAFELIRGGFIKRTFIGLDYFDASINRIAAWVIGMRNMQKSLLTALLEPSDILKKYELDGDYTHRLAVMEEMKSMPFSDVWDAFCEQNNVPVGLKWINEVEEYENSVLSNR